MITVKSDAEFDKLLKIRPVLDHLQKQFSSIPLEKCLSVDEQLCATKARSSIKQYLPMKPHKWGYKFFVLSGVSGFAYNFEVYTGKENCPSKRQENEKDLGACSNIVTRLLRPIPKHQNFRIFFDNYYTTIPLAYDLSQKGMLFLGTIRRNRIPNCKLPTEKDLKNKPRGYSVEYTSTINDTELCTTTWKDNKAVNLLSNFQGRIPISTAERFDKKEKVTVECPAIIKEYNRHMGGVDLLDSLIGRYKIKLRPRKWYMKIFNHLIDMTTVNAWLLHKRVLQQFYPQEKAISLNDFRLTVGDVLCKAKNAKKPLMPGRPSKTAKEIEIKRKKRSAATLPEKQIRLDEVGHWPLWMENRVTCKFPNCDHLTFVQCEKCKCALCLNKDRNCFKKFHCE